MNLRDGTPPSDRAFWQRVGRSALALVMGLDARARDGRIRTRPPCYKSTSQWTLRGINCTIGRPYCPCCCGCALKPTMRQVSSSNTRITNSVTFRLAYWVSYCTIM